MRDMGLDSETLGFHRDIYHGMFEKKGIAERRNFRDDRQSSDSF